MSQNQQNQKDDNSPKVHGSWGNEDLDNEVSISGEVKASGQILKPEEQNNEPVERVEAQPQNIGVQGPKEPKDIFSHIETKPVLAQELPPDQVEKLPELKFEKVTKRRNILKTVLAFIFSIVAVYLLLTAPTHYVRLKYSLASSLETEVKENIINVNSINPSSFSFSQAISSGLSQGQFERPKELEKAIVKVEQKIPGRKALKSDPIGLAENRLSIPRINVVVPVVWNSSADEGVMLANLQKGVAHYGFTSLPNENSGNVFITGHSSYYWWDNGQYKTIFALLDKLKKGDQAFIQYDGQVYIYEMNSFVTVSPSNVSVTDDSPKPILSLMTCVPVGTALNRLVIKFDLVGVYKA